MSSRFEEFIKAGLYLRNWSTRTVRTYRQGLNSLGHSLKDAPPTKQALDRWVLSLRAKGLQPSGCNMYIRTVNSFLTWLHEEGHASERLRIKLLKAPQHQLTLLSASDVKLLRLFKPHTLTEWRTWTLTLLLLDTGIRIEEALTAERKRVDLDQQMLTVMGKGSKERRVFISHEMRKVLYRWMSKTEGKWLLPTRSGSRVTYRNAYREIAALCTKAGIQTKVHPHLFRHCFAANYIRQGGDIYRLSRLLGHTAVSTTQLYLRSMGVEDLRTDQHDRLSPLVS